MATPTAPIFVVRPPAATRGRTVGIALAITSALAFSSSGPVMKPLFEAGWTLGPALLARMGTAALLLSPALILAMRRERGFLRRHWRLIVGFGLTGVAGCQLLFFAAMQRMPVAIALLIQYLAPVLLVLLAWVRTRRAPSRLVLGGSVVAMTGLVLVVDVAGAQFDGIGVLLALGAAFCAGAYFLISARAGGDLPPLALASGGLVTGAALMAVLVITGIMPFAAPPVEVVLGEWTVPWWAALAWVGIAATTTGYALGVMAVPRIGSRLASFIGLSEVLFALGFAWLLLGETPAPIQFVGGALILVGVILVRADASSDDVAAALADPGPLSDRAQSTP